MEFIDYEEKEDSIDLQLVGEYNSIGEIPFSNEPELFELCELIKGYEKKFCWKFVMFNKKIGYLDLGCQSAPLAGEGVFFRIKLIENNVLRVYELSSWIS